MKIYTLFRGINVGHSKRISMGSLRVCFEGIGLQNVFTYINSGNVLFESNKDICTLENAIVDQVGSEFGEEIRVLIKTNEQMKAISKAIPDDWKNDENQKSDVAYLFREANSTETLNKLPVNKDFINMIYVDGAIILNVKRSDYNKSKLSKITSHPLYKSMTVRNVNTAKQLAFLSHKTRQ